MIRVGIINNHTDNNWLGGVNYIKNLVQAVLSVENRKIEPVLIVPGKMPDKLVADFSGIDILRTDLIDRSHPTFVMGKVMEKSLGRNYLLEAFFKRHNISLISHARKMGRKSAIPNLFWVPDFQHKRRPDFFKPSEIADRDAFYKRSLAEASHVVLSSYDAQSDMAKDYPDAVAKSSVLHFVSGLGSQALARLTQAELKQKYGFSGDYFYLPNQFWIHKNHEVVLQALALLKSQGVGITVISTGKTDDYRHPDFFAGFKQKVADMGLQNNFRILGIVPYDDLTSLMTYAVAVINPSHFEGWSTTVEESKAMGKTVILSNIPVHLEQAPQRGFFFDPDAPAELAKLLVSTLKSFSPSEDTAARNTALRKNNANLHQFGETYQNIVLKALGTPIHPNS